MYVCFPWTVCTYVFHGMYVRMFSMEYHTLIQLMHKNECTYVFHGCPRASKLSDNIQVTIDACVPERCIGHAAGTKVSLCVRTDIGTCR